MPQTKLSSKKSLERQIAACRRKMESLWESRGCTDPEILAASIELDQLLNQYQKLDRALAREDSSSSSLAKTAD